MKQRHARIVIVGAGPSGVGVATRLHDAGVDGILVLDRLPHIGGITGFYTDDSTPSFVLWTQGRVVRGSDFARMLGHELGVRSIECQLQTLVRSVNLDDKTLEVFSPTAGLCPIAADVLVLACGAREKNVAERGWIFGKRPARVLCSLPVLQMKQRGMDLSASQWGIVGSEAISYAVGAEVAPPEAARPRCVMFDQRSWPSSTLARLYFMPKVDPTYIGSLRHVHIAGGEAVLGVLAEGERSEPVPLDAVLVTGSLVPNTDLLLAAGIPTDAQSRCPSRLQVAELEQRGVFLVGNVRGRGFGGQRAFYDGVFRARRILKYLRDRELVGDAPVRVR